MPDGAPQDFIEAAREVLAARWGAIRNLHQNVDSATELPAAVSDAIDRAINSKTKTYRYVLPTQLLAKVVDMQLDARSVQAGSGLSGAFDARSLCHEVIVPFDRENDSVLGGSSSPYLNNPLRITGILPLDLGTLTRNQMPPDSIPPC